MGMITPPNPARAGPHGTFGPMSCIVARLRRRTRVPALVLGHRPFTAPGGQRHRDHQQAVLLERRGAPTSSRTSCPSTRACPCSTTSFHARGQFSPVQYGSIATSQPADKFRFDGGWNRARGSAARRGAVAFQQPHRTGTRSAVCSRGGSRIAELRCQAQGFGKLLSR